MEKSLEPGELNVELVRVLLGGDRCPYPANMISPCAVPVEIAATQGVSHLTPPLPILTLCSDRIEGCRLRSCRILLGRASGVAAQSSTSRQAAQDCSS